MDLGFEIRERIEALTQELKGVQLELDAVQEQILEHMDDLEKDKHTGRLGTIGVRIDAYPSMPKDAVSKQAFFDYLKKKNCFDELITVNSQTLRGFYKREWEAQNGDPDFKIPGLTPYERRTLTMRRKK